MRALSEEHHRAQGLTPSHAAEAATRELRTGASLATSRLIADQLWHTSPFDVPTFSVTVLVITGVALLACLVPARRAMNVDPMVALRRD